MFRRSNGGDLFSCEVKQIPMRMPKKMKWINKIHEYGTATNFEVVKLGKYIVDLKVNP
jgi:hypothetical protein